MAYQCTKCGGTGHNRRTCGKTAVPTTERLKATGLSANTKTLSKETDTISETAENKNLAMAQALYEKQMEEKNRKPAVGSEPAITPETPCVAAWENNFYDDSDFCGMFRMEDGSWRIAETGSTRHAGGFIPRVNASDEIKEEYKKYYDAERKKFLEEDAARRETVIKKDSVVRVDRPRSKYHGVEGKVSWVGEDKYRPSYNKENPPLRVGIKDEANGETVFVPIGYCQVFAREQWNEPTPERLANNLAFVWSRSHPHPR